MPIFLEPDQRFPVVLECDKDKPAESMPKFLCKSQSSRGMLRIAEVLDRDYTHSLAEAVDVIAEEVMEHCVGWEHIPHEFTLENVKLVLHYYEMRELLRKIAMNQHVQAEEKKS
jgi:hypothetical protein